ncbi:hypothetical protein C1H46_000040 [Malus baccata]|uniref:Asparagine synthetase domain-containing protein n=1 Tax=Malus baccata TaxID=106549 RepID=A0A540NSV8_MALBA|nr:hypothetical protein C1H46_000040 [Malus baccata]
MCGILAVLGCIDNSQAKRSRIIELSRSDCEVIAHLYEEHGEEFVDMLDGMFSFVLLDTRDQSFIAARDAIGSIWFASEMKALSDDCERLYLFLLGIVTLASKILHALYYLYIHYVFAGELRRWYNPPWFLEQTPSASYDPLVLRKAFEKAVVKRLMIDVPFGVLLSGGLDSSLVAAVASRYLAESEAACQWGSQLHTFCIGLEEGIDALEEVIYHIETYDVTTIRASTPMFLMSRKIKSLGVKMVISGIKALHLYDCLRANKSTSAWGVEARVPFLDKEFINIAMNIDPEWKMPGRIEKWVLRNAFDNDQKPYLPKHILYRQKEQFSDGVGYSWIDGLKDHANSQVTDSMLINASFIYPENTPTTKEAYYYRTIFEKFFPKNAARSTVPGGPSVACSTAKAVEWDAE